MKNFSQTFPDHTKNVPANISCPPSKVLRLNTESQNDFLVVLTKLFRRIGKKVLGEKFHNYKPAALIWMAFFIIRKKLIKEVFIFVSFSSLDFEIEKLKKIAPFFIPVSLMRDTIKYLYSWDCLWQLRD